MEKGRKTEQNSEERHGEVKRKGSKRKEATKEGRAHIVWDVEKVRVVREVRPLVIRSRRICLVLHYEGGLAGLYIIPLPKQFCGKWCPLRRRQTVHVTHAVVAGALCANRQQTMHVAKVAVAGALCVLGRQKVHVAVPSASRGRQKVHVASARCVNGRRRCTVLPAPKGADGARGECPLRQWTADGARCPLRWQTVHFAKVAVAAPRGGSGAKCLHVGSATERVGPAGQVKT